MSLWGCRLGSGFAECASTSYTLPQLIIVLVVAGALAVALLYCTVRLFFPPEQL